MQAVAKHDGPDTAQNDEQANDAMEGCIVPNPGVGEAIRKGGKASVAKGGDGVEDGLKGALAQAAVSGQSLVEQEGSDGLGDKGENDNEADDVSDL